MKNLKVSLREATPQDQSLILSSWLRGAYHLCPAFKDMPKSLYYGLHEPAVKLTIMTSNVLCAVDIEDPSHVLGFIVYRHYESFTVIHWLYVKQAFRYFGLGEYLIQAIKPKQLTFTSHETTESQRYFAKKRLPTFHVPHLRHGEWYMEHFHPYFESLTLKGKT